MPEKPNLLILTAAFGEGHNSAARNLAIALESLGARARVVDPCLLSAPSSTALLQWGYRLVTTHFPRVWEKIYRGTDQCDFSQPSLPLMRKPESFLESLVAEEQPTAIITTYPIYPYFLKRYFAQGGQKVPVFTVVTDSIEINASWLRAPSDHFLVTDATTQSIMQQWGIAQQKVIATGFPVNPIFSQLSPVPSEDPCKPFRILYFPTAKKPFVRRHSRALLEASPEVELTIVMGKNFRLLQSRAREIKAAYPGRVKLLGWTRKAPQLLNTHHLVVGKAGGATVHEAIAARCPMLIHHLVPGQEEGNLALLRQLGAGQLAGSPEELSQAIQNLLANGAQKWKRMKHALEAHNTDSGAMCAAKFILSNL
jgi:processive 1,2-diacylglycerol beta-glucosyltransferase